MLPSDFFSALLRNGYGRLGIGLLLALFLPLVGALTTDAPGVWPVAVLAFNLGLWSACARFGNRKARLIVYNGVAAAGFLVEAAFFFSYYLQDAGFNDAFFYHLRLDLVYAGGGEFLPVIVLILLLLTGFLVLTSSAFTRLTVGRGRQLPFAVACLLLGLFLSPPAQDLVLYARHIAPGAHDPALYAKFPELDGPPLQAAFSGAKKPNIVLIFAESLGQRYFDEAVFPGLVPRLKELKGQSVDFTNVAQGAGAGWTVAGMVASQCGYPLADSHEVGGNELSLFEDFLPGATCLGDLLERDGYHLAFVGGADERFAGKGNFLRSHGYAEVIDGRTLVKTLADQSYVNEWGVFDDTLFDFAIRKFRTMSSGQAPFLLTLLTLDTHHPNGFLSKTCGTYGSGENSSLNAVHCADYLITRFISQIRKSPYSDNTIVVVLSDHVPMRNQASPLLAASGMPKRLTFFVNTPDGASGQNRNPGLHYDVAPTILDLAGYQLSGQMGFGAPLSRGAGYLPGKFGEDQWEQQSGDLLAISGALWNTEVALASDGIRFDAANLAVTMGGRAFNIRSGGASNVPESVLFLFDAKTLRLEKIEPYPYDQGLAHTTLSNELLEHKEQLALVISHAGNLPGFTDLEDPSQWVFFFGKAGSRNFSWGPITGDLTIPYELIRKLANGDTDEEVVSQRARLIRMIEQSEMAGAEGKG